MGGLISIFDLAAPYILNYNKLLHVEIKELSMIKSKRSSYVEIVKYNQYRISSRRI